LFVSAIRLVLAQRLIRQLDDSSKQPYQPTEAEMAKIREIVETLPEGVERPDLNNLQLFKPGSTPENPYGFKGQLAIRELFLMTGQIRTLLEGHHDVLSAQEIEAAAVKSGMRTMLQDGILKVCAGQTTLDEVFRVVG
jgi:type II secretory ATPase GspE/PulE/Tfp pilus assembly ATPase PilB-like protein